MKATIMTSRRDGTCPVSDGCGQPFSAGATIYWSAKYGGAYCATCGKRKFEGEGAKALAAPVLTSSRPRRSAALAQAMAIAPVPAPVLVAAPVAAAVIAPVASAVVAAPRYASLSRAETREEPRGPAVRLHNEIRPDEVVPARRGLTNTRKCYCALIGRRCGVCTAQAMETASA